MPGARYAGDALPLGDGEDAIGGRELYLFHSARGPVDLRGPGIGCIAKAEMRSLAATPSKCNPQEVRYGICNVGLHGEVILASRTVVFNLLSISSFPAGSAHSNIRVTPLAVDHSKRRDALKERTTRQNATVRFQICIFSAEKGQRFSEPDQVDQRPTSLSRSSSSSDVKVRVEI